MFGCFRGFWVGRWSVLVVDAVLASVCIFCVGVCLLCRFIGWGGLVVEFGVFGF